MNIIHKAVVLVAAVVKKAAGLRAKGDKMGAVVWIYWLMNEEQILACPTEDVPLFTIDRKTADSSERTVPQNPANAKLLATMVELVEEMDPYLAMYYKGQLAAYEKGK